MSLVIRLHFVQPGRLQTKSLDQRLEREDLIAEEGWVSGLIYPVRDTSFLIAFLSGTHGVLPSTGLANTGVTHRYPPLLGFFTSRAIPKGRSNQQDIPHETYPTVTVNGQHSSKHLSDIHFSAPGSIPPCSSVPGISSDTTPFL